MEAKTIIPPVPNPLSTVFSHDHSKEYFNTRALYLSLFNTLPCWICQKSINVKKAQPWFATQYTNEIRETYFNKRCFQHRALAEYDDFIYVLHNGILTHFDSGCQTVEILFSNDEEAMADRLHRELFEFKQQANHRKSISLVVIADGKLDTVNKPINTSKMAIGDHYNDDFISVHQTIHKRLSKKNDKGIVLLHGKPGTGKTSYIRHLITKINKQVFFLPPHMAESITNPDLISLLLEHPNSIFVIEDAENIVMDRQQNGSSAVSSLLNLSDGLLSDCLNIQIICSFNTDISKVDRALMRKGRLIASYEFRELETKKARQLSEKLGFRSNIHRPMTLTDIYNQQEPSFKQAGSTPLGFNFGKAV